MKRFQLDRRRSHRKEGRSSLLLVGLCLALLALLAIVQVVHVHPQESGADHCALCVALHAAAPASVAAAVIILVSFGMPLYEAEQRKAVLPWHPTLFTRPPPFSR